MSAGARLDELRTTMKQLLDLGASPLTLLPLFRRRLGSLTTWARFVDVRDHADALILALIEERRRTGEEGDDVLTMLLAARDEDGRPMTDRELRDELVTLLVAGHETTASALSWGFEQMLRAPDVLERVTRAAVEEDDGLPRGDGQGDPAPPPGAPDRAAAPDQAAGRDRRPHLPAGPGVHRLHLPRPPRRADLPRALRVPPRALPRRAAPGKFSWIPFGGGVRRCLGASFAQLEMRIALQAILSRVEVTSALDGREGIGRRSITLSPRRGTPITVRARVREPQVAVSA